MPFVLAAAAGVIAGLALGGRPSHLLDVRIRAWPLLLVPLAWRLVQLLAGDTAAWQRVVVPYVFPAALLVLVAFAAVNWRLPGLPLIGAGAALNALVVALNGGRMPIPLGLVRTIGGQAAAAQLAAAHNLGSYAVLGSHTRLPWLADVLLLPGPIPRALSAGDVVLMVGVFVALVMTLLNRSSPRRARFFRQSGSRVS